jgi:hypothetical protein
LEQSAAYRWLSRWIDPVFNRIRNSLLLDGPLEEARDFAREATHPKSTRCRRCQAVQRVVGTVRG